MIDKIKPEHVVALYDSREQLPVDLKPLQSRRATLTTGDYSVAGLEHVIAIERKGLSDLIACIGRERERFEKEVHRLLAYPVRCLVVEACWPDIEQQRYRGQVHPNAAIGSLLGWIAAGLPVIMAGDHHAAGRYISRLLYTAARRRWQENAHFLLSITEEVS